MQFILYPYFPRPEGRDSKKTTIPIKGRPVYQLMNFRKTETLALYDNALKGQYEPFAMTITVFQDFKMQI